MPYTIRYVNKNKKEHTLVKNTKEQAMDTFMTMLRNGRLVYGYISDDEALDYADEVMDTATEIVNEEERALAELLGMRMEIPEPTLDENPEELDEWGKELARQLLFDERNENVNPVYVDTHDEELDIQELKNLAKKLTQILE